MLSFIVEYYDDLLAVIGAVVVIASFIVKVTPTQKDDAIVGKLVSFLENFSIWAKNNKDKMVKK